jgi:hypothetical protein
VVSANPHAGFKFQLNPPCLLALLVLGGVLCVLKSAFKLWILGLLIFTKELVEAEAIVLDDPPVVLFVKVSYNPPH